MRMPRDEDDWVLYNKKVPKVLQDYADDGYKIVVFRCSLTYERKCMFSIVGEAARQCIKTACDVEGKV